MRDFDILGFFITFVCAFTAGYAFAPSRRSAAEYLRGYLDGVKDREEG